MYEFGGLRFIKFIRFIGVQVSYQKIFPEKEERATTKESQFRGREKYDMKV